MPKTKLQSFFIVVFFVILNLNIVATQEEYGGNCQNSELKQSPINIVPPFTFTDFNGEFQFNTLIQGFLENNNSTLKLEGDFGVISYGNRFFNTYEMNFKSPSEHTIGDDNISFPLEIQISSISEDDSRVNIAILFSEDEEDSSFLYTLGFGKGLLQHLKPSQFLEFKGSFSLKEIMPQENKFFMYQGTLTSTPCSSSVWLIAYNTFRISQRQIDDFPKSLLYKRRDVQDLKHREIFITFYPGLEKKTTQTQTNNKENNYTKNATNNSNISKTSKKIIISDENDKMTDIEEDVLSKIQNKDSFKILGDTTDYDFDFYGGNTAIKNRGIKYIRNEDYLVVYDKEYIKETDSLSLSIDDNVIDEIIDSLDKKANQTLCLKKNFSNTDEKEKNETSTNDTNSSKTTENQTNDTLDKENNTDSDENKTLTNLFEKDMFDMWTVEKITKNLDNPSTDRELSESERFTFKKPEKNKIFLNINKPISFLQFEQKTDVSQTTNPFFVITEDMIKNSQSNPIIIDANTLKNLISNSNNNSSLPKKEEQNIEMTSNSSKNEILVQNDVASFVQTKLQGIIKERISDDDLDTNNKKVDIDGENIRNSNQLTFDGYIPNGEDYSVDTFQNSKNYENSNLKTNLNSNQNSNSKENYKLDELSLKDKSPEEIKELKDKMQRIVNYLDDKLEDTKKIVYAKNDDSSTYKSIKEDFNKNIQKTQTIVKKIEDQNIIASSTNSERNNNNDIASSTNSERNDLNTILDGPNEEDSLQKIKKIVQNIQNNDFPCQGKIATDKTGKWDGISVFNVSNWPQKCKFGSYQSPLHIGLDETFFVEPHLVSIDYGKPENNKIEIFNDGYKLIVKGMFGTMKYGEHELPTKEIYIHHPSEHTFGEDQSRTDFEIQILHEDKAGARVMMAVFLHNMGEEEDNEFLEQLGFDRENEEKWLEYNEQKSILNEKIDLLSLVSSIPHYITYDGSLTSPPCTEGIKWIILRKRKKVTQKQIKAFQYLFGKGSNVRGTQDLGSRKLKIF